MIISSNENAFEKIKKNPIFESISEDEASVSMLYSRCTVKKYKIGTFAAEEGESCSSMYILISGKAEIIKRTPAGDAYIAGTADEKDNFFFGEFSLIRENLSDFSVRNASASEYLVLSGASFRNFSETRPALGLPVVFKIAEMLSDKVKKVQNDMMTLYDALVHEIKS